MENLSKISALRHYLPDNKWENTGILLLVLPTLYIFLPFRLFNYPVFFSQIEEWCVSCLILSVCFLLLFISLFIRKQVSFKLTVIDLLLFFYLIYTIIRSDNFWENQENIIKSSSIVLLYLSIRIANAKMIKFFIHILIASALFMVLYEYFLGKEVWKGFSNIKTIYGNMGIWGGFVGITAVGAFGLLLSAKKNKHALTLIFSSLIFLLVCSKSRAAWVGTFAGMLYLILLKIRNKYSIKTFIVVIMGILLASPLFYYAGRLIYQLKPASADGRYYIWKISSKLFLESPLFGAGVGQFKKEYMYRQAEYLSANPESPFSSLADEISAPFSEPLRVAIEQGLTGVFILAVIVFALFTFKKVNNETEKVTYHNFMAIIICLFLFSCFSYPSSYIQFCFILIICLAVLSGFGSGFCLTFKPDKKIYIPLIFTVSIFCCMNYYAINYLCNINKWHKNIYEINKNSAESLLDDYSEIEPVLKSNPNFLNFYAQALAQNSEYEKAIIKLKVSLNCQSSYITYLKLGDCYEKVNDFNNAVKSLEMASQMIPNRFEPVYLRIKCFHKNRLYDKADSLTKVILEKERKIDTPVIDLMLKDVRQWKKERERKFGSRIIYNY
jgi:O-antigen ligase